MINAPLRTRVAVVGMSVLLVSALSPAFASTRDEVVTLASADRSASETASRSHVVPLPAGVVDTPGVEALTVTGLGLADTTVAAAAPLAPTSTTVVPTKQATQVFKVVAPTTTAAAKSSAPASTTSSGSSMPNGDLPGWKYTYGEDFNKTAISTAIDATYANSFCGYPDGTGNTFYKAGISTHGGLMDWTLDGTHGVAGTFGPPSTCWGKTYGRYSIRFKSEGAKDNATAFMLWPSSDVWGDGEIDFPEGNLDKTFNVFHHGMGCGDCTASDGFDTGTTYEDWHTATTEWLPTSVKYYVDGKLIKTVTHDIPTTKHRMTVQVIPNAGAAAGHLYIDWVAQWDRA